MHDKCKVLFHQGRKKENWKAPNVWEETKTQLTSNTYFSSPILKSCNLGLSKHDSLPQTFPLWRAYYLHLSFGIPILSPQLEYEHFKNKNQNTSKNPLKMS